MSYQRDFDKYLTVGVIGTGSHCYRNILPVMNYLPVRLSAVCDINPESARKTAAQYGCRAYTTPAEMYEKESLDAVFICVGPKQHPALITEALRAKVNVWVEKPISVRTSQIEEMIRNRGDCVVVVGLKKAFMPATYKALEVINSPDYGNLRSLLAVYPMKMEQNGEELLAANETPNWLLNGVHPLSFLMRVGGEVKAVTTVSGRYGNGAVLLEYKSGVMGTLHLASGASPSREMYGVYGENWSITVNDTRVGLQRGIPFEYTRTFNHVPKGFDSGEIVWEADNCLATLENKALFTQGFYNETKYFCDCVLNGEKPTEGTLEFALEIMRVYEAAFCSHGARIELT